MLREQREFVTLPHVERGARMIDAHQHFWQLARGDYDWLTPDLELLYRDFGPDDLAPLMRWADVGRSVVVQAAPTVAETRYLLGLAAESPWVAGVVGWIEMTEPGAGETLEALAADGPLCGVRPMIQDIQDPDWMLDRRLEPALRALVERDLTFDALVKPIHLPNLLRLLERNPELRVVIDHGAKPEIAQGRLDPWRSDIERVARETGACCKLSGIVTEAAAGWDVETLRPVFDHLMACFGPGRLLWGSDWPVVELAGGYDSWRAATLQLLADLADHERLGILGDNAARFYRLEEAR